MSNINRLSLPHRITDATATTKTLADSLVLAAIERLKAAPPDDILAGGALLSAFVRRHLHAILARWGRPLPTHAAADAVQTVQLLVLWGLKISYVVGRGMSPSTFVWQLGRWRLDQFIRRSRCGRGERLTGLMASQIADRTEAVGAQLEREEAAAELRRQLDRLKSVFTDREWRGLQGMMAGEQVNKRLAFDVRQKLRKHLRLPD